MALRAGYYGLKKKFIDKVNKWDQIVFPRSEQAVLGARNLAPKYNMASGTVLNGITVTYDADNIVNLNGTATGDTFINLRTRNTGTSLPANGRYKVRGKVSDNCYTYIFGSDGTTVASSLHDKDSVFDYTSALANFGMIVFVKNGTVLSNQKVYPMITFAADTEMSYSKPAMTNAQLTEYVNSLIGEYLRDGDDLNDFFKEGVWMASAGNYLDCPVSSGVAFRLEVKPFNSERTRFVQIIYTNETAPKMYIRTNFAGTPQSWYRVEGTVVS